MTIPMLDIVLVGYRSERFLPRLREEIGDLSSLTNAVHYADNAGNTKSLSRLWNELAMKGSARFLCVMNPDVVLSPGWDEKLVGALEHPEVGVALADNAHTGGDIPSPPQMAAWAGAPRVEIHTKGEDLRGLHFYCPIMMRRTWETLHGVDERLRFYNQDCEFLTRMFQILGLRPAIVRGAAVWHYGGASTNEAVIRNEIDRDRETRVSEFAWNEIRAGRERQWHLLDDAEKAAVRANPSYARMGGSGRMRVHIVPQQKKR